MRDTERVVFIQEEDDISRPGSAGPMLTHYVNCQRSSSLKRDRSL